MSRYRWRTWMRGHLPYALVDLFPKGHDCGDHDWYYAYDNQGSRVDECYHCEARRVWPVDQYAEPEEETWEERFFQEHRRYPGDN